jgi:hypothetical protein
MEMKMERRRIGIATGVLVRSTLINIDAKYGLLLGFRW